MCGADAAGLGAAAVIWAETPQRDSKPGRGRLHRSPEIPQLVPTRYCLRVEIKVSCTVAGKCKYCLKELLIVKPHYLGVIITGTPCTAKMRPRALWSWAPQEEDVSCLRAVPDENEQAETWEWGEKRTLGKESVKGEGPGEQLWWPWLGSHRDPMERKTPGWRRRWRGWERLILLAQPHAGSCSG